MIKDKNNNDNKKRLRWLFTMDNLP